MEQLEIGTGVHYEAQRYFNSPEQRIWLNDRLFIFIINYLNDVHALFTRENSSIIAEIAEISHV